MTLIAWIITFSKTKIWKKKCYPRPSTWYPRPRHETLDPRQKDRLDLATERLPVPNLPLCHWSIQLFDLRAQSSTDVPVLLLNQPINMQRFKLDPFEV